MHVSPWDRCRPRFVPFLVYPQLQFSFILNCNSLSSAYICRPAVNFLVKLIECEGSAMSDVTVRFVDENEKELGRDYFAAPSGQCTVSGYGNIKTITPRGGNSVFITASADLCGKTGGNIVSTQMPISGALTDCF